MKNFDLNNINNFSELIQTVGIEIPLIQRDYVQGRDHKDALDDLSKKRINKDSQRDLLKRYKDEIEKRDGFVDVLINALINPDENGIELNFIYGLTKETLENSDSQKYLFSPLDGQQRLTTLMLLSWILLRNFEKFISDKGKIEKFKKGLRSISYETRPSSSLFCNRLFKEKITGTQDSRVSIIIKQQPWFNDEWAKDPSVVSMLQMLDCINEKITKDDALGTKMLQNFLDGKGITFELLDMEDFQLKDGLYIQMNARGKQLTEFENLKSEFIKHLRFDFADMKYPNEKMHPKARQHFGDEEVSLCKYFEYSIEHQWNDLFWPFCKGEIARKKAEIERKEAEGKKIEKKDRDCYPVIDQYFMNFFRNIHEAFYFMDNDCSSASDFSETKESRIKTFWGNENGVEHIMDLFQYLDLLILFKDKNIYEELFYNTSVNFDIVSHTSQSKVRLFMSGTLDLFKRCANDSTDDKNKEDFDAANFTNGMQILLISMLKYAQKYGVTPDYDFKLFVRKVRNLVEGVVSVRKKDIAITNTLKIIEIFRKIKTIEEYIENKGNDSITVEQATIEDLDFIFGQTPNGLDDGSVVPTSMVVETLLVWDALEAEQKRQLLILSGYRGRHIFDTAQRQARFFGDDGRWKTIFMSLKDTDDDIVNAIKNMAKLYSDSKTDNCSGKDLLIEILSKQREEKLTANEFDFVYYMLQYEMFLGEDKYVATSAGDLNKLDMLVIRPADKPVNAYHSESFVYTLEHSLTEQNKPVVGGNTYYLNKWEMGNVPISLKVFDKKDADEPIGLFTHRIDEEGKHFWQFLDTESNTTEERKEDTCSLDFIQIGIDFVKEKYPDAVFESK